MSDPSGVLDLIGRKQVVICAGSGGVGKTTTSAAIAAGMADRGKKAAVLTIDPARRLANSLGLSELGNEETRVELPGRERRAVGDDAGRQAHVRRADRHLRAGRADARRRCWPTRSTSSSRTRSPARRSTWRWRSCTSCTRRAATTCWCWTRRRAATRSTSWRRRGGWRGSSTRARCASSRAAAGWGSGIMGKGTGVLFSIMKRATGVDLLRDLSDFFNAFGSMTDGFSERARRVEALLGDSRTTFLLVTSPREASIQEAEWFAKRLREEDMPFGGVIVNRVRAADRHRALAAAGHRADRPARRQAGRQGRAHARRAGCAGRAGRPQHGGPEEAAGAQAHPGRARAGGRRARPRAAYAP